MGANRRENTGKNREGNLRSSPLLAMAPGDVVAVMGQGAALTETAVVPRWTAYIEAELRVKGREAVERVAHCNVTSLYKRIHRWRKLPTPFFCGLPGSKIFTWQIAKGQKKTF